jgi:glutaminase
MKRIVKNVSSLLLAAVALTVSQCAKKKDDANACKTCKALAAGPDQPTIQKEVCTSEEEEAFRNANPGREITCN